ncbi:MAG: phosphoribosylanthranilate isomerase [Alphaproteobacteria bacterium]
MVTIKICGLSSRSTVEAAIGAGADMIGLVFHTTSPRFVSIGRARELSQIARDRIEIVALVVDADDAALDEIVTEVHPDWLQLHGTETPERVAAISRRFRKPLIKAHPVQEATDIASAAAYGSVAEMILFDAKAPTGATRPGGHGRPFDWTILQRAAVDRPFMLSGGLNARNVADAIQTARPAAVDVSSGVETAPGRKSDELIGAFVAAARLAAGAPAMAIS